VTGNAGLVVRIAGMGQGSEVWVWVWLDTGAADPDMSRPREAVVVLNDGCITALCR